MSIIKHALAMALVSMGLTIPATGADYMPKNDMQKKYSFSPGVITEGGRIVWLSGQIALRDEAGKDISGQFEPQVRAVFSQIDSTLKKSGGSLADLVTMTVFVTDARYLDRFVELRRELFKDERYPASAFIAVSSLPFPGVVIEIQGVGVIGDQCSNAKPCAPK